MKKYILVLSLFAFLVFPSLSLARIASPSIPSPSITVTSPSGGQTYNTQQSITVTWTSVQMQGAADVEVGLFSNTSGAAQIVGTAFLNSSGQGTITIPASVVTGQYVVKVYLPPVIGVSNPFTINGITPPSSITVTSPSGGQTYTAGQQVPVKWTSVQIPSTQTLEIGLFSSSSVTASQIVGTAVSNSGQGTITIPASVTAGQYIVKVYLPPLFGVSSPFAITVVS
jgi:hypothetical protein